MKDFGAGGRIDDVRERMTGPPTLDSGLSSASVRSEMP